MINFLQAAGERQHEDDGVEDRPGEQTVGAGGVADGLTEAFDRRKFPAIGAAEYDAGDEAALADFVNQGLSGLEGSEAVREAGDFFRQAGKRVFRFKNIEAGQRGGAA